ncbi:hypothetical protein FOMPIDRAFT_1048497 [Fomitopsis schrenkii]|uniref:Uncharacterized protein n=1 Tax=Fomitopsis schrenkii TaxID=2126942 RepID=S8EFC4_FOMSC|nr:hypothetical protein FOMPIDRAFT_1048497 [Fomitopsis schrenkii]
MAPLRDTSDKLSPDEELQLERENAEDRDASEGSRRTVEGTCAETVPASSKTKVAKTPDEGQMYPDEYSLLFVEAGILSLILFYSFSSGAHLITTKSLAVITSLLIGTICGYKFAQRTGSSGSPATILAGDLSTRGARAWTSSPSDPRIVVSALPRTTRVFTLPLLITTLLPYRFRLPWRVSSFPPHQLFLPWGTATSKTLSTATVAPSSARCVPRSSLATPPDSITQAWRTRYADSQAALIQRLSVAWGASGISVAAGLLATSVDTGDGVP